MLKIAIFNNSKKDNDIISNYISKNNLDKNRIHILKYQISSKDDPKTFIEEFCDNIEKGDIIALSENIVYDEDAYLNTVAFHIDNIHRRFYSVTEIVDFFKDKAMLNFFVNFKEEIKTAEVTNSIENVTEWDKILNMIEDFPEDIKNLLCLNAENEKITSFSINKAVFVFTKK